MISEKTQNNLDYWAKIEGAAKDGTGVPEHDCHAGPEDGCQVCADYYDSRRRWIKNKKTNNENSSKTNN